jgi:hypothetical protein
MTPSTLHAFAVKLADGYVKFLPVKLMPEQNSAAASFFR